MNAAIKQLAVVIALAKKQAIKTSRFHITIMMTPELAKKLLAFWVRNRPRNNARVRRYKAELLSGKWAEFAHGVVIGIDGFGLDGWNRLTAIVESGISAPMDITFNEDPANFKFFNTKGATRTGPESLSIAFYDKPWAKVPRGAARYHELLKAMLLVVYNKNSVTDIAPYLKTFEKAVDFSYKFCAKDENYTSRYDLPVVAASIGLVSMCDTKLAADALPPLKTGRGFDGDHDPLQVLRDSRLMRKNLYNTGWARRALAMETLAALYCKKEGEELKLTKELVEDKPTPQQLRAWLYFKEVLHAKYNITMASKAKKKEQTLLEALSEEKKAA